MKDIKGSILAGVCITALVAITAACVNEGATPTETHSSSVTVTNLRIPTPPPSPTPAPTPTPGQLPGDSSRGQSVYDLQCKACHGANAAGGFAPALNTPAFAQEFATDASLFALIRNGSGAMPAYGASRLNDQEVADLIAYLRSLP